MWNSQCDLIHMIIFHVYFIILRLYFMFILLYCYYISRLAITLIIRRLVEILFTAVLDSGARQEGRNILLRNIRKMFIFVWVKTANNLPKWLLSCEWRKPGMFDKIHLLGTFVELCIDATYELKKTHMLYFCFLFLNRKLFIHKKLVLKSKKG